MVSMLAFRLFGDMDAAARQLQSAAYAFFNYQVDPTRPEATAFKEALDERLFDVMRTVGGLSFEAIGAVGALLLIWAALGLLISFEDAANRIYRAPRGRGWLTRIGVYWTVLTLGPILLLVVLYAAEYWLGRAEALPVRGAALRLPRRVRLAGGELPRPHPPLQAPPEHPRALAARALRRARGRRAVGGLEVGLRPLREPRPALPQALRRDRPHPALPLLALPQLADRPVRPRDRLHPAGHEGARLRAQGPAGRARLRRSPVAPARSWPRSRAASRAGSP